MSTNDVMSQSRNSLYKGSTVLISGGTGSIGLELTKALLKHKPKQIRLLSNDENGLFEARRILNSYPQVVYKLGDVRDTHSLEAVTENCDFVFHAAALKHVIFCEENPSEAISTNILGTKNMIDLAMKHHAKKFVYISTDKAVNPISVMGATKLLGEKLVLSASCMTRRPTFCIVRFGNVLGSRGSVISIFEKQVRDEEPVSITDPMMTRFIMLPHDAAQLVLRAGELAMPGEIFILRMKSVRIKDLADASIEFYSTVHHKTPRKVNFKIIGATPGEKTHEELLTNAEVANSIETRCFYIANPSAKRSRSLQRLSSKTRRFVSNTAPLVSKEEIISMLSQLACKPV